MNGYTVERNVIDILRQRVLMGSDREISLSEPLGELGIGLDSLAMVEFVTALEKEYEIAFDDDIWTERELLTLQHFISIIRESSSAPTTSRGPSHFRPRTLRKVKASKLSTEIHKWGSLHFPRWTALQLFMRFVHYIYQRQTFHILSRNLSAAQLPNPHSSVDLVFSEACADDVSDLDQLWPRHQRRKKLSLFRKRLASGYICLIARQEGEIIGIDWLSESGDDDPFTGLRIKMRPETCFGIDLHEHLAHQGKGVGLSLLAFSLAESKRRGFHTQVTMVEARNVRMLSAAVQLLGFSKIGSICTTRIFCQPYSEWRIGNSTGKNGTVLV